MLIKYKSKQWIWPLNLHLLINRSSQMSDLWDDILHCERVQSIGLDSK